MFAELLPPSLPPIVRLRTVLQATGLTRGIVRQLMAERRFPKPLRGVSLRPIFFSRDAVIRALARLDAESGAE
jgi:predicted DNA-binding transcriptional regulator AlpA